MDHIPIFVSFGGALFVAASCLSCWMCRLQRRVAQIEERAAILPTVYSAQPLFIGGMDAGLGYGYQVAPVPTAPPPPAYHPPPPPHVI